MRLTTEHMLERIMARDPASNGRFLTGVLSTGIYCLPSCPARHPLPRNVRFFADESAARGAGLRPCRRCRPDDFYRRHDPDQELVTRLAERMRGEPAEVANVEALVALSGVGWSKLHGLFRRHYHTTPAGYLQRARLAHACRSLLGGERRILDVALDAGYESTSAFHDNFRRATGMRPGDYRRLGEGREFRLRLPDDYRTADVLRLLGRDPLSVSERVRGTHFAKAIRLPGGAALLHVEFASGAARCRVETRLQPGREAMAAAHAVTLRLLGLAADPAPFEKRLLRTPGLSRLVRGRRGMRVPLTADPFEGLVWAILGQQVNLPFACTLRRRLVELSGEPVGGELSALPAPATVAQLDYADLTSRQFSRSKAEYLVDAARQASSGGLELETMPERTATVVERELLEVRGLGPWSTQYMMMRACGFEDCVPAGDSALATALQRFLSLDERPAAAATRTLMEPFAPFRSLATMHLWMSLGAAERTAPRKRHVDDDPGGST